MGLNPQSILLGLIVLAGNTRLFVFSLYTYELPISVRLVASIILLICQIFVRNFKNTQNRNGTLHALFLFLLLFLVFSSSYSRQTHYSERGFSNIFELMDFLELFFVLNAIYFSLNNLLKNQLEGVLTVSFVVSALYLLISYSTTKGLSADLGSGTQFRTLGASRTYATAILGLTFFIRSTNIIKYLSIGFLLIGIMHGGSRATLLALITSIFTVYLLALMIKKSNFKSRFYLILQIVLLSTIILYFFQTTSVYLTFFVDTTPDSSFYYASRDTMIWVSLEQFKMSPIFGLGYGSFVFVEDLDVVYPHNLLLSIIVDIGLVGLFTVFCIFVVTFKNLNLLQSVRHVEGRFLIALFLFSLISSIFYGSYFDHTLLYLALFGIKTLSRDYTAMRSSGII